MIHLLIAWTLHYTWAGFNNFWIYFNGERIIPIEISRILFSLFVLAQLSAFIRVFKYVNNGKSN